MGLCLYISLFVFQWLPSFYVLLSSIFFCRLLGAKTFLFLMIQPLVFFFIHFFGSSTLVWICAIGFLCSGSHWTMAYVKTIFLAEQVNTVKGQGTINPLCTIFRCRVIPTKLMRIELSNRE